MVIVETVCAGVTHYEQSDVKGEGIVCFTYSVCNGNYAIGECWIDGQRGLAMSTPDLYSFCYRSLNNTGAWQCKCLRVFHHGLKFSKVPFP